jgi:lipopolysaccharide exporter
MTNIQNLLFGFGGFYLLVRMLDKNTFGVWVLFMATTTIFETARNGMIQNGLIKFLSHSSEKDYRDIVSASFFLNGLLMLASIILNFSIAGFLADLWHYEGLRKMFYVFNIVYLIQGILSQFQWIEQSNFRFKGILITSSIRYGGIFFYILGCYIYHLNVALMNLIYVQAICATIASVIQYSFIKKFLFFSRQISKVWVTKLFSYGKFVFGTAISAILTSTINQMMLGAMLSANATSIFNVAVRIINLAAIPSNVMGVIVFPQSAKRYAAEGREAIKYLYEKSVGSILALLIPCLLFLFLFPGFVVNIIAGPKYAESVPIVRLIALTCLAMPFARQFGTILDSIGKPKINFIIILISVSIELVLVYFMVKHYGIIGAVYATLVADVINTTIMQIILFKELRVNILHTFIYAARFYPEFFKRYVRPVRNTQDANDSTQKEN